MIEAFPEVEWSVLSAHPGEKELPRLPGGLHSLISPWGRTLRAYGRADAVVFGGGSLFTDVESVYACLLWGLHAWVAWILRKPILLAFQGIGPFRTRAGEGIARWVVGKAAFVSVRDSLSYARGESWKLNKKIIQSFDPIYKCFQKRIVDRSQKLLIIIPRKNSGETCEELLKKSISQEAWDGVRILSLEPDHFQEKQYCENLLTLCQNIPAFVYPIRSLESLAEHVSLASLVIAQRYHGALAALALGVPLEIIAQGKGDKLDLLKSVDPSPQGREVFLHRIEEGESGLRNALSSVCVSKGFA